MCGGNKGQSQTTSQTNQTQTYAPNPQAYGYINNAIQQGQAAAATPFQAPVAPVAGFSQDQLGAFQQMRDLGSAGQGNFAQAANYFSPQGTAQFYNPYAQAVTDNMKDIFGAQQAQTTGQLTQAAGGVGADRIAVGQADLAKQQDLAAGQTYASLWNSAAQQAQAAGQGQMQLGQSAFNNAGQAGNALLGTGGLQQQLSQAQLNAPYQQQLAALAYPFQTAQFNAAITGGLAPGLGGTTMGQGNTNGTSTPAQPSIWSQLLGAGTAAAGIYGGLNSGSGKGTSSNPAYGMGNGVYGGSSQNPVITGTPGATLTAQDYGEGFAEGGDVPDQEMPGVSTKPINIAGHSFVPETQITPIKPNIPQLNLSPPPQPSQSSSSGPSLGDIASTALKIGAMFVKRGGRIVNGDNPYAFAEGGAPSFDDRFGAAFPNRDPDAEPIRLTDPAAMEAWRNGVDADQSAGLPRAITGAPTEDGGASPALAFSAPQRSGVSSGANGVSPYSQSPAVDPEPPRDAGFAGSPWAALTAAGLGMMAGTSPFAGVNIGHGGQAALKTLEEQRAASQKDETIDQAARRLALEAKHHEDQYIRETVGQKQAREQADRPYHELTEYQKQTLDAENYAPVGSVQTKDGLHPALYEKKTGRIIDGITQKPPEPTDTVIQKGGSKNSPEEISHVVDGIIDGSQPPVLTGLYGDSVHVRSGLHAKGFNLAQAQVDWDRAKKATAAVNSSRMTQYVALNQSVDRTIDEVKDLSKQMELGGIPFLNKLELGKYIQTQGNTEKGQLATRYMTAVNTLKEEFANLANGGYAPTEAAWKLANDQVNGNYGVKQLGASVNEIQRLIRYRLQAVPNLQTLGPGGANRYTGQGATAAPAGGGGKPDVTTRFGELIKGGKTEAETYAILKEEGYQ